MKRFTIFMAFICLFAYLKAQDKNSDEIQERIDKFSENLLKGLELNKLEKLPDFNFQEEDMQNFQERMKEWQEKYKNLSEDLAMNLPNPSVEFSHDFPKSYSYSFGVHETAEKQQNNDQIFNKLSDIKGVEVVYISKSLLGMAANMDIRGMDVNGLNIKNIMSKLESLQIFSSEQSGAMKKLKSESEKLIKNNKYETLMFVKDEDSKTVFYINRIDNQKSEMLMISEEPDEISIIRFTGSFTVKDLQELKKDKKKSKR